MPSDRQIRFGLWLALLLTANANRKHYNMPTTWVPHTIGNTIGLAMPEIVTALDKLIAATAPEAASLKGIRAAAREVTEDPPGWAGTMAPVTLAYIVSHPRFNIYKGELGEIRMIGFGLDAIPHSATAFSLTRLVYRGLEGLARHTPAHAILSPLVIMLHRQRIAVALAVLAGLTLFYELGEYRIHNQELTEAHGDVSKINMMWDPADTARDVLANGIGWLVATWLHENVTRTPAPTPVTLG